MQTIPSKTGNFCFGCGADNPIGLKLTFYGDREDPYRVWTEFQPPDFLAGGPNMMHGGFISLLLDEASSKVLSLMKKRGVTRHLEVSFDKPVPLSKPIRLEAQLENQQRRKHFIDARIMDQDGQVLAHSRALFFVLS